MERKINKRQWLLLRGLTRGQYHWVDFPKRLQQQYPEDEVILIDLPGNGYRNEEDSPLFISEYTEDLRSKLDNKGNLYIFALSFGAMVVLDWLNKYPGEIQKAFLVNTSVKGLTPFYKRLLPANYISILKAIFASKYQREKKILEITCNNLQSLEVNLLNFERHAEQYPFKVENLFRQLIASVSFKLPVNLPNQKIELFLSQNDRLVSCENTYAIANFLGLVPTVHPWAGHDMILDDTAFVLQKIHEKVES